MYVNIFDMHEHRTKDDVLAMHLLLLCVVLLQATRYFVVLHT
jgi:hypothetical protein